MYNSPTHGEIVVAGDSLGHVSAFSVAERRRLFLRHVHAGSVNALAVPPAAFPVQDIAFTAGDEGNVKAISLVDGTCMMVLRGHRAGAARAAAPDAGAWYPGAPRERPAHVSGPGPWSLFDEDIAEDDTVGNGEVYSLALRVAPSATGCALLLSAGLTADVILWAIPCFLFARGADGRAPLEVRPYLRITGSTAVVRGRGLVLRRRGMLPTLSDHDGILWLSASHFLVKSPTRCLVASFPLAAIEGARPALNPDAKALFKHVDASLWRAFPADMEFGPRLTRPRLAVAARLDALPDVFRRTELLESLDEESAFTSLEAFLIPALSACGRFVLVGTAHGTVDIFDVEEATCAPRSAVGAPPVVAPVQRLRVPAYVRESAHYVRHVAATRGLRYVAAAFDEDFVFVWRLHECVSS